MAVGLILLDHDGQRPKLEALARQPVDKQAFICTYSTGHCCPPDPQVHICATTLFTAYMLMDTRLHPAYLGYTAVRKVT